MAYNYSNYNNPSYDPSYANPYAASQVAARQQAILRQVYLWMTVGLSITGAVAAFTSTSPALLSLIFANSFTFFGLIIAELALVFVMSAAVQKMSSGVASALFIVYALLNGLTLSIVFLVYLQASIASTFFITAGTFGAMSLYGYTTKRDLSGIGHIAFMGLIGIILASIVNLFFHSPALYWAVTYIGVLVFVALTAYDTQKIKRMTAMVDDAHMQRFVIIGALTLYLDFVNLFLFLLRIFGRRR